MERPERVLVIRHFTVRMTHEQRVRPPRPTLLCAFIPKRQWLPSWPVASPGPAPRTGSRSMMAAPTMVPSRNFSPWDFGWAWIFSSGACPRGIGGPPCQGASGCRRAGRSGIATWRTAGRDASPAGLGVDGADAVLQYLPGDQVVHLLQEEVLTSGLALLVWRCLSANRLSS